VAVKTNTPYQKIVKVADPAAGAEFALTAPGNGLWRVLSVGFRLVTSAVVANRTAALVADDGTDIFFRTNASLQQAASLTVDYGAFAGASSGGFAGVAGLSPLIQDGVWLQPGWRLRTVTGAIDATDQYSRIVALVEEYPTGPGTEWTPTANRAEYERS
jgi:hypothetical protein